LLVIYVFLMMLAAGILAGLFTMLLNRLGVYVWGHDPVEAGVRPVGALMGMTVLSLGIGTALATFFSRRALKPIRELVAAMRKVARGDFSVRAEGKGSIHELEDLYSNFNQMTRELSSTQTLRADFINNFSHEFKTPIVSIRGFAKLLKDGNLSDAEHREYLEIIIAESGRLSDLATHVLNLSKYEAMEIIAEKERFPVDEEIRRAIAMTEPQWEAKGLTLNVTLEAAETEGNRDLLQQVWLNLLDNAIKFSNDGGKMYIQCDVLYGKVRCTFRDEGIGMEAETLARIFDKFYQGDTSHKQGGNGLGLSMVQRIVQLHGGEVIAESEVGLGSVFTVTLTHG